MLRLIIMLLIAFWLIGFIAQWGGGLIHLLLLIAGVIFIAELLTGRRTAVWSIA